MQQKILLLGPSIDKSTVVVSEHLEALKVPYFVYYPDRFYDYDIYISIGHNGQWQGWMDFQGNTVCLPDGVSAIWIRRPWVQKKWLSSRIPHHDMQEFTKNEIDYVIRMLILNAKVPQMSPFYSIRKASNLLVQYAIAKDVGLQVPRTLITRDPERAIQFAKSLKSPICVKPMSDIFAIDGVGWAGYTQVISVEDIERNRKSFQLSPVLLQEFLDKDYELRITVVGDEVFVAKLDTQANAKTQVDWRKYYDLVPHSVYEIPQEIKEKIVLLVRRLGLVFGAIDMVVTRTREYFFLEINPNGQWMWIEEKTGLPISVAIARWLYQAHLSQISRR